jgi:hypothetical protein
MPINLLYFLIFQFHAKEQTKSKFQKKNLINQFTDADVALASNGKSPPHALHNISAI